MDSPSKNIKSLEEELKVQDDLLRAKDQTIAAFLYLNFGVDRFGTDDSLINLYTGFTNYTALAIRFNMQLSIWLTRKQIDQLMPASFR